MNQAAAAGAAALPERPRAAARQRREEDEDEESKGIRWGPIILLVMMTIGGFMQVVLPLFDSLQKMGVLSIPDPVKWYRGNKYRPCLSDFYADWAPEKLGQLDATLSKYEGREKALFSALQRKYGKKVQTARCSGS